MTVNNPTYMEEAERVAACRIAELLKDVDGWKQYHYIAMRALIIACEGLPDPGDGFKAALEQAEAEAAVEQEVALKIGEASDD